MKTDQTPQPPAPALTYPQAQALAELLHHLHPAWTPAEITHVLAAWRHVPLLDLTRRTITAAAEAHDSDRPNVLGYALNSYAPGYCPRHPTVPDWQCEPCHQGDPKPPNFWAIVHGETRTPQEGTPCQPSA